MDKRVLRGLDLLLAAVAAGVLALSFWLNVRFGEVTLERISSDSMRVHVDFETFWRSAEAFLRGGDVYDTGATLANLNPPLWILLSSPLGLLEPLTAYRTFVLVSLAATVGFVAWSAGEARLGGGRAAAVAGAVLLSSPLLATLALGQIYPLLALGLVASWAAWRRGHDRVSGVPMGLVVAVKPSLAPVLLLPLALGRWGAFGVALLSGAVATLVAAVVVGFGATLEWIRILLESSASPFWDNASLPATAARLFTENRFTRPLALLPGAIPLAQLLGVALVVLTALRARYDPEAGFWALVAAALLASPIAWHNYLLLVVPGVVLLLARGRVAVATLLLSLQLIPPQWPLLWQQGTALDTLMLSLYALILLLHWAALLPPRPSSP
ncbi:hypothetical protein Rxycam_01734 [Rubrobacter xylanophilus DSM 9941]|uniref:glycosyltransferase family 87 protein n=1 Tax=Rubrobacter xylanophilus TaxID=49319 RepID=UPI001C6429AC|nr:glycosyltransferase family 87 protein [Rubrobacter xylanophilus]QYJ15905.1 hypothetical protein Rxycam_01734 [Rubrobacter xylanophilus DSM 9941]